MNTVTELLGIQFNIDKANRTDQKVQNLASYLTVDMLRSIHTQMSRRKATGVDNTTKDMYAENQEENLSVSSQII